MSEIIGMSLPRYSLSFGEALSKVARHQLALLCLEGIRDDLSRKPIPNKSRGRGRPPSPVGILAHRMRVHPDSVKRWTSLKEVQASDRNAEKLAEMAFWYSPEGVAQILREDVERYGAIMGGWLSRAEPNYGASPYGSNEGRGPVACPYCPAILPDQVALRRHVLALHTGTLAREVGAVLEEEG